LAPPGVEHELAGTGDDDVVGGEEASFLVRELLIEGAARDARQPDHVSDRRLRIATFVDGLDHAAVHTRSLVARYVVTRHPIRTVRKPPVHGRGPPVSSTHPHDSR